MCSSTFPIGRGRPSIRGIIGMTFLGTLVYVVIFQSYLNVEDSISLLQSNNGSSVVGFKFYRMFATSEISEESRIDKMVLLRRLVLYSVHLLNKKIQSNASCVKWWANPLTMSEFYSFSVNSEITEWNLTFKLEPGHIPVKAVTRQVTVARGPINVRFQQEIELVSITKLDYGPSSSRQEGTRLDGLCLFREEKAELRSLQARAEWNETDPELDHWPPNSSFIVSDYMNFSDQKFFLISPGQFRNRNTSYCNTAVRIIVLIHSAPNHYERRTAIRQTYGNSLNLELFRVQLVFFLGTVDDKRAQESVNREVEQFDDIVQANFVDSYHNITLKTLSLLQWIYLRCTNDSEANVVNLPTHVLKADDDIILNIETIVRVADSNPDAGMIGAFTCGKPCRAVDHHKYYLPKYVYPPDAFNGFLVGGAYLIRADLINKLLRAALTSTFWHLEDTLINGELTRMINVLPENSSLFSFSPSFDPCFNRIRATSEMYDQPFEMINHWDLTFLKPLQENCTTVNFKSSAMECPSSHYL